MGPEASQPLGNAEGLSQEKSPTCCQSLQEKHRGLWCLSGFLDLPLSKTSAYFRALGNASALFISSHSGLLPSPCKGQRQPGEMAEPNPFGPGFCRSLS